jgi:hypothetical protein
MIENNEVTEEDKALMAQYNIQSETKTLFFADGYKYDKLKDAVRYAKFSSERKEDSGD